MMKFSRQAVIILLMLILTAIYLNGTRIFSPFTDENKDQKYLESTWNTLLFGDRKQWSSMSSYIHLMNEYDHQKNFGLMNHAQQAQYMSRFSALASNAFADWQSYHVHSYSKRLTGNLRDELGIDELVRARSPLLAFGVLAAAYTGRTLRYRMNPEITFETRTTMDRSNFNGQYVGWRSSALAASAGGTYGNSAAPMMLNLRKQVTSDVSVNYDLSTHHSVGVSYSKGF